MGATGKIGENHSPLHRSAVMSAEVFLCHCGSTFGSNLRSVSCRGSALVSVLQASPKLNIQNIRERRKKITHLNLNYCYVMALI